MSHERSYGCNPTVKYCSAYIQDSYRITDRAKRHLVQYSQVQKDFVSHVMSKNAAIDFDPISVTFQSGEKTNFP